MNGTNNIEPIAWLKKFILILVSLCLINCSVIQGKSSPSQYTTDAGVTAKIKAKFVQFDLLSAGSIHVETQNGIVQISGFVSNSAQIDEASKIAQSVRGVRGIVNNLVVSRKTKTYRY